MAEKEVNSAFTPQVQNGHVLEQTLWNWDFEAGTDRITPGGLERLNHLARRRPCADPVIFLQTANDLPYDPNCPDRFAGARQELDAKRAQAIQKYLVAYSVGRPVDYQVLIHDPGDVTIGTPGIANSILLMYARYRGGLLTAAGAGGIGSGGGGGAGGGGGR
jgi:hypothetical protein